MNSVIWAQGGHGPKQHGTSSWFQLLPASSLLEVLGNHVQEVGWLPHAGKSPSDID